mgnify:CR=1 FL=1
MPWKVSSEMDERLRFIARLLEGEAMTDLCVEFGISRKTGYKIYDRYKQSGAEERQAALGGQEDQGTSAAASAIGDQGAITLDHSCRARPQWPGQTHGAQTQQGTGHRPLGWGQPQ